MSRPITINFYGFWSSFRAEDFLAQHPYLRSGYTLQVSDDPDFAICGVFPDSRPVPERAVKVFFTGENVAPDFAEHDWAMSFEHFTPPEPRHLRLPIYAWYMRQFSGGLEVLIRQPGEKAGLDRPHFCNFVYRNGMCRPRNQLFRQLNQYKHVDAPATLMNNMPMFPENGDGNSPAKQRFARNYKFTIAYENTSHPGYTTEKIYDAMAARSIPIYWGNPLVHLDFNPKSFLNRHEFDSDEAFIQRIIRVDQDDELYTRIFNEPYWHDNIVPEALSDRACMEFWDRVFASGASRGRRARPRQAAFGGQHRPVE